MNLLNVVLNVVLLLKINKNKYVGVQLVRYSAVINHKNWEKGS